MPGGGRSPGAANGASEADRLLVELRKGGEPPLTPLGLGPATASDRPWPIGPAITAARRAAMRLIAPGLGDLLTQLERDRRRSAQRIAELERRVADLDGRGPGS